MGKHNGGRGSGEYEDIGTKVILQGDWEGVVGMQQKMGKSILCVLFHTSVYCYQSKWIWLKLSDKLDTSKSIVPDVNNII